MDDDCSKSQRQCSKTEILLNERLNHDTSYGKMLLDQEFEERINWENDEFLELNNAHRSINDRRNSKRESKLEVPK